MSWVIPSLSWSSQIRKPCCRKGEKKCKRKGNKKIATGEAVWAENPPPHYNEKDACAADKFGETGIDETNIMVPLEGESLNQKRDKVVKQFSLCEAKEVEWSSNLSMSLREAIGGWVKRPGPLNSVRASWVSRVPARSFSFRRWETSVEILLTIYSDIHSRSRSFNYQHGCRMVPEKEGRLWYLISSHSGHIKT